MKKSDTSLANKSIGKYVAMTFIGLGLFIFGLLMAILTPVLIDKSGQEKFTFLIVIGYIIAVGPGVALPCVGIPCWIVMGIRIKVARNKLNK